MAKLEQLVEEEVGGDPGWAHKDCFGGCLPNHVDGESQPYPRKAPQVASLVRSSTDANLSPGQTSSSATFST